MVTVPGYPKLDVELREKLLDDDALDRRNCDDLKKKDLKLKTRLQF